MANQTSNGNKPDSIRNLLELSTEIVRNTIEVDGKKYPIRSLDEFSIKQGRELQRQSKKLHDAIYNDAPEVDDVPGQQLDIILESIVVEGHELKEKLRDKLKLNVLDAFLEAGGLRNKQAESQLPEESTSSSPDSADSTQALALESGSQRPAGG